jgi:hypothetical protein
VGIKVDSNNICSHQNLLVGEVFHLDAKLYMTNQFIMLTYVVTSFMPAECIRISKVGFSRSTRVYRQKEAHSGWMATTYFMISSLISASNSNWESEGFSLESSLYSYLISTLFVYPSISSLCETIIY